MPDRAVSVLAARRARARSITLSLAPLLEPLEEPFRLLDVPPRIGVLRVELEDGPPLGDGLRQLLLAIEPHALAVVPVDGAAPRLLDEARHVLVVGLKPRELGERAVGLAELPALELLPALPVERDLLD